jgi:hypothetical protein
MDTRETSMISSMVIDDRVTRYVLNMNPEQLKQDRVASSKRVFRAESLLAEMEMCTRRVRRLRRDDMHKLCAAP